MQRRAAGKTPAARETAWNSVTDGVSSTDNDGGDAGEEERGGGNFDQSSPVGRALLSLAVGHAVEVLHPTPVTLHPTPHTLNPKPYTLHPTTYTTQPKP